MTCTRSPWFQRAIGLFSVALLILAGGCGQKGLSVPSAPPAVGPGEPPPTSQPLPVPPLQPQGLLLKILTYNIWGKPGLLGTDLKARMERLPETLKGYDVVVVQEAFADETADLAEKAGFPYWYHHNNGSLTHLNSGLYAMSRYPIRETKFQEYSQCTTWDCFARKGVLLVRLGLPDGRSLDVYTTHYQAEEKGWKVRLQDNTELANFVHANNAGHPALLLGDLNLHEDSSEYADLQRRLPGLVDVYRRLYPGDPGYTSDPSRNPNVPKSAPRERIDYALVLPPANTVEALSAEITHTAPVRGFYLSDHFGLAVTVRLQVGP